MPPARRRAVRTPRASRAPRPAPLLGLARATRSRSNAIPREKSKTREKARAPTPRPSRALRSSHRPPPSPPQPVDPVVVSQRQPASAASPSPPDPSSPDDGSGADGSSSADDDDDADARATPGNHLVGRWRRRSALAPFFKRPLNPRLVQSAKKGVRHARERGTKMLRAAVTGDPRGTTRVRDYVRMPRAVQTIDKVSFVLGVVGLLVTQLVATETPEFFWLYYLTTAPWIFLYRAIQYSMIKYHYFLIDFCYYANLACFAHILAWPSSGALFRSVFAYANGPILWAIPLWRNSLVFHSHDKVQSVYIHCVPAILTWCTRWYGQRDYFDDGIGIGGRFRFWATPFGIGKGEGSGSLAGTASPPSSSSSSSSRSSPVRLSYEQLSSPMDVLGMATDFYLYPTAGYVLWQVCYLLKTELWDVKRLDEDPELVTSLRWLASDYKAPVTRWALRTSRRVGLFARDELFDAGGLKTKFVFVSLQLIYTVATFLPIPLCYVSKTCHTTLMLAAFLSCIWNGAEYYIDIFSRRYAKKFDEGAHNGTVRDEDEADAKVDVHR